MFLARQHDNGAATKIRVPRATENEEYGTFLGFAERRVPFV